MNDPFLDAPPVRGLVRLSPSPRRLGARTRSTTRSTPDEPPRPSCSRSGASSSARTRCSSASSSRLLAGGHLLLEGVPGPGQDAHDQDPRRRPRRLVPAHPVHARTSCPADLVGTRIYRPGPRHVRHRARPGVLQLPARRRDQPRARPRSSPRCSRSCRSARSRSAARATRSRSPFLVHGDPEPDRVRGHLPAAGGPGRPVHDEGRRRLPDRRPRRPTVVERSLRPAGRRVRRSSTAEGLARAPGGDAEVYVDPRDRRLRRRARRRDPRARSASGCRELEPYIAFGASPRGSINLDPRRARPGAHPRPPLRRSRRTSRSSRRDVLRHRIVPSFTALAEEVTRGHDPRPDRCRPVPAPPLDVRRGRSATA